MTEFKCTNCEFCGKEVPAELMCTLILNDEQKVEQACWCICKDCEENFRTKVKDVYDCIIADEKKAE
jgi:ribosome-binding protein aMBF1 (putative translation factor)